MDSIINRQVVHWENGEDCDSYLNIIKEEPLVFMIQGKPYLVVMRTPGEEIAHAVGFCLSEGIIDSFDDFDSIGFCDDLDSNSVTIQLKKERYEKVKHHLTAKNMISQSGCGICGRETIEALFENLIPVQKELSIKISDAKNLLESLPGYQVLRHQTKATHGATIYRQGNTDLEIISFAEDVGRHNAVDKAVGKLVKSKKIDTASIMVVSSRVSYELVQKACRAGIPIILSISRPTSFAAELSEKMNITLGCFAKNDGLYIFCGSQRIRT